jgi:hypothetical protein
MERAAICEWQTTVARFLIFVIAFLTPTAAFAQLGLRSRPGCVTNLGHAQMVAPGTGWAMVHESVAQPSKDSDCTNPHLFWTDSNGQSWREISPPHMPAENDPVVFFLDRSHGWVLSEERLEGDAGQSRISSLPKTQERAGAAFW